MQLSYIKKLSKAYLIDNKLYESQNITDDELTENFYNAIKVLRSDHPDLYESILDANLYEQQKIFKTYFDLVFEIYQDYTLESLDESELEELEEGVITTSLIWVFKSIVSVLSSVGTGLMSTYALIAFLIVLFWPNARRKVSRAAIKTVIAIFKGISNIGSLASKHGDSARIAYSIIHNNANKCLKKCEYDPSKAGPSDYMYQLPQGSIYRDISRIFMSISKEDKLDCVRECYLETLEDIVKLTANMYFQCLRNTGDLSRLPLEKDFSIYQKMIVKTSINRSCDSFMNAFNDALSSYDTSLRMIYAEEEDTRRKYKLKLMNDIYGMQKNNSQMKSNINTKPAWKPIKKY